MGNLAVKCEDQWQQRKTVTNCVGRSTVDVRVMKADGSGVEEFDRPVVAAEVMYQFPDYVVVQWCPRRNTKLGKRGQLKVLQRYEVLAPGEIYILFPIPVEVVKSNSTTARRSRHMQSTKDRLSLLLQRSGMGTTTATTDGVVQERQQLLRGDENPSNDARSSESEVEEMQSSFPGFRVGGWQPSSSGDEVREENETSRNEEEEVEEKFSRKPDLILSTLFAGSSWRPALVSIPESPIGFHSRPGSPMTPIAFRLVCSRRSRAQDQPK